MNTRETVDQLLRRIAEGDPERIVVTRHHVYEDSLAVARAFAAA